MFIFKPIQNVIRIISVTSKQFLHQTHYEVLGLSKNCTTQEIKNAFIELSKKFHPDKVSGKFSNKDYVKIVEAYNILIKPRKRRMYDWELTQNSLGGCRSHYSTPPYQTRRDDNDPLFWKGRQRSHSHFSEHYYGIPGLKKMSNGTIATFCVIFAVVGGYLQFLAIRHSVTLRRDLLLKKSQENEEMLTKLHAETEMLSKEERIALVENRLS